MAFLLKWTPYSTAGHHLINVLRFRLDTENGIAEQQVQQILSQHCKRIQHWRSDYVSDAEGKLRTEYNYRIVFKQKGGELAFLQALKNVEGIMKLDLSTRSEPEAL